MKNLFCLAAALFFSIAAMAQRVYEVKFITNATQYRAALVLWDNGTGKMRVRYYANGRTRMVEEYMNAEDTRLGIRLTGYNPVYPGTSVTYSSYSADNFYLSQDEEGNYSMTNIDDMGNVATCYVRAIKGYYEIESFLAQFDWKLE